MTLPVDISEPLGYLASVLVLVTFCMRGMVSLRLVAITSNLAFIGYAALAGIGPVLLLHMLLLPVNALRLWQALAARGRARRETLKGSSAELSCSRAGSADLP